MARQRSNRVVAITGGAAGIGHAFAELWVSQGGHVVLMDIDAGALAAVVEGLGGEEHARGIFVDVTSDESVRAGFASIAATEGRLDASVHCAGVAGPIPSAEVSDEEWTRMVDIHLHGTMRACRAAYPLLKSTGKSAIVNVSSVAGHVGIPAGASYCAAKAGIEGLTRTLAVEWARDDIRVNCVAPGYVRTPLIAGLHAEGKFSAENITARTPMGRLGEPYELASVIGFMASDAASYVTGQSLVADGGMTINGNWYT